MKRLGLTLELSLPLLGPEAAEEIKAILSPEPMAIMAGVLVGGIASHAFGLGEIIDVILLVLGVATRRSRPSFH